MTSLRIVPGNYANACPLPELLFKAIYGKTRRTLTGELTVTKQRAGLDSSLK
jgi:hypothetical protein